MKMVDETVEEEEKYLTFDDLEVGDLFICAKTVAIIPNVYQKIGEIVDKDGIKYNAVTPEDGFVYSIDNNEEVYEVEAELRYKVLK